MGNCALIQYNVREANRGDVFNNNLNFQCLLSPGLFQRYSAMYLKLCTTHALFRLQSFLQCSEYIFQRISFRERLLQEIIAMVDMSR